MSTGTLMVSLLIIFGEKRYVVTADVNGAYLHAEIDGFAVLKLKGEVIDIMCKVNDAYMQNLCLERDEKLITKSLLKSLYGCGKLALLWYEFFTMTLQELGVELNLYNEGVINKVINGK